MDFVCLACQQLGRDHTFCIAHPHDELIGGNVRIVQLSGNGHKCHTVRGDGLVDGQNVCAYGCKQTQYAAPNALLVQQNRLEGNDSRKGMTESLYL